MGVCSSSRAEDVFTKHTNDLSVHEKLAMVVVSSHSSHLDASCSFRDQEKMRVSKASKILIIGDNRIKVATACYISAWVTANGQDVEVIVGTRDPDNAKNSLLLRAGVKIIRADMNSPGSLLPAIRDSGADTVFLVSPNRHDRSAQTTSGISACRRAGVGHVVVLSSTCVERKDPSIFGDQCKHIEAFIKTTRLSYTIVRIPILIDNYLSQLQSMEEYGIFYRPLPPNSKRNSIAVSDVGAAVGTILLTPGVYADKTISLNGPYTDCETAAAAFTVAFNKPIIYEQVSYESYKETLLEAKMPEWQVNGILELFKMFERQEPFCQGSMKDLVDILGRAPYTVFDLAAAALATTRPRGSFDSSDHANKSDHGLHKMDIARRSSRSGSVEGSVTTESEVMPYSRLKILRSIDSSPTSALSPAGIAGPLRVTLCMITPSRAEDMKEANPAADLTRNLDYRYCILLDGIFTFLPPSIFGPSGSDLNKKHENGVPAKTRAVGSMENRSMFLSGYVIRRVDEKKISLKGSKGESTSYLLEAVSAEECQRWVNVISAHVEHVDSKAGSKWIF